MKRLATVISTDAAGTTLVELDNISRCLRCSRGQGCGAAIVDPAKKGLQMQIDSAHSLPVRDGQQVLIEIDEHGSGWLWSVFGAYGLPLLGLLLATGLATLFADADPTSAADQASARSAELLIFLSALAGLVAGLLAWRQLASRALACAERSLCLQSARIVAVV